MKFRSLILAVLLVPALGAHGELPLGEGQPAIYSGLYENGAFQSLTFVNSVVGWDTFFNAGFLGSGRVIANVEAGLIWDGHEAFLRPDGSSAVTTTFAGTGASGELDYHASMVGHVLAGSGYISGTDPASFTYVGLGMAPLADIWSGAIATSFSETEAGSFNTTTESTVSVYREFFQGIGGVKPDVINSSWGGSDPTAGSPEMLAIDGLASQNTTVAFVMSAGNGNDIGVVAPVSAPGSTFNSITVGSLGGTSFLEPSTFSSSGPVDFYIPAIYNIGTDELLSPAQTLVGVRAAVDIAAPGENFFLAAYLGATGSLGAANDPNTQTPSPTDLYFINASGTSFAAPIVSGGIALLKDVASTHPFLNLNAVSSANDTRVIKSVLMAGATETIGWNNGQAANGLGVITTTQSLDYQTGAGALDLNKAVDVYLLSGTRDVAGTIGGAISSKGWDFASVSLTGRNNYVFSNPFETAIELTVSLNWFAGRTFNNETGIGEDLSFADLNLEVWQVLDGVFSTLLAQSTSVYNNAEFLRIDLPTGTYGIRVTFNGLIYDNGSLTDESYGLAWNSQAVPEPSTIVFLLLGGVFLLVRAARRVNIF
ncbi:MAG: S8 family serine peptidase [Terrimicrobiaceae bacterium]